MSTLLIKGYVFHPNGAPCVNATVEIIDIDSGGNGDDIILTVSTNSNGFYQGTSREWVDKNTIKIKRWEIVDWGSVWPARAPRYDWVDKDQEVPDVLVLKAKISQNTSTGWKTVEAPFFYVPAGISQPLMVYWTSAPYAFVIVNYQECFSPFDVQAKVRAAGESNASEIRIETRGPVADALQPLLQSREALKNWLNQRYPGIRDYLYSNPVGIDDVIIAIAILVIAFGVASVLMIGVNAVLISIAVAIILALYLGYTHIEVRQETHADGSSSTILILKKV